MEVRFLQSAEEVPALCPVLLQLRPQYTEASLIEQINKQRQLGYQLAYVVEPHTDDGDDVVLCVAGFVIGEKLAWGKHIYVDDLVSADTQRSRGAGKLLLDWLKGHARANGCSQLHLDSGVTRYQAHRFYLREHFSINSHHFAITDLDN